MVERLKVASQTEVFRYYRLWHMREPVCKLECRVFRKVALVEYEKKFRALGVGILGLEGMRISSGEVPDVTFGLGEIERGGRAESAPVLTTSPTHTSPSEVIVLTRISPCKGVSLISEPKFLS